MLPTGLCSWDWEFSVGKRSLVKRGPLICWWGLWLVRDGVKLWALRGQWIAAFENYFLLRIFSRALDLRVPGAWNVRI